MSDKKEERENTPPPQPPRLPPPPPPPLFLPTTSPSFSPFDFDSGSKRPRYTSPGQWKPVTLITSPHSQSQHQMGLQNPELSPSPSPQAQLPSPETSSSPSLSPIPSSSAQQEPIIPTTTTTKAADQLFRKGKYVSPVWKPHEMLWLARAWRVQYQGGDGPGSRPEPGPGESGGRGKTRAEKDREVAEYLKRHGVSRDAKTAGTKWDNMLGEFRKVYEWERGGEREQVGKSYFRLSPYERKIHRLPASFDEEVFEELSQFMGPRMRPSNVSSSSSHHYQVGRSLITSSSSLNLPSDPLNLKGLPPPLPPFRDYQDDPFPLSGGRTRQMESYLVHNPARSVMLGFDPNPMLDVGISPLSSSTSGSRVELRRIGKMRMSWEESVSLWAEEGEYHRGRVKVQGCSLLNNADELLYFDDSMVACTLEAFEEGPLKGFSVDRFMPGQQLKVFGRKKPPSSSSTPLPSTGFNERIPFPIGEPSMRWEFQDPTEYYLGCLRSTPATLPSLLELSWYIQDPPPEELRLPLRKDIYRDLPQGKDLFFTTSNEPLDCKSFTIDILSSIIRSNPSITSSTSTSRDSFIPLWDDCINRVISKFSPSEITFIRKPPKKSPELSSLQDQWPNVSGMMKNICLWRGEEVDQLRESQSQPSDDPSITISEKISWCYYKDVLPYVLGYYAIGHNVTFCALSPSLSTSSTSTSTSPQIIRTDLYSLDLSNPSDRLKSLVPCWRIATLLASLAEKCTKSQQFLVSDFERHDLGNDTIIEKTPTMVTKLYPNKRRYQSVKEVYDILHQRIPHSEHIISSNEGELSLVFKPRGIRAKPKNCSQLVLALKQVTKALVALHDLSFMHRDLSWEKVMLRWRTAADDDMAEEEEEEWFVAGFEEAVGAPQINPAANVEGVESGRHAPEMGRGVHGVKVDVWGVGYLVKTSGVKMGKQLKELEGRCMEVNPEHRPTAADCYHHLLQIQSSLSTAATNAAAQKGGSSSSY